MDVRRSHRLLARHGALALGAIAYRHLAAVPRATLGRCQHVALLQAYLDFQPVRERRVSAPGDCRSDVPMANPFS